MEMNELLDLVVSRNASDLHIAVGKPPVLRVDGRLEPLDYSSLTAEETENLMRSITSENHQRRLKEVGGADFGFAFGDIARFRVSIYKERGNTGIALRLIPSRLMSFEEIGLPPDISELLHKPRGLILVTGPTGCGKTTTLATMIDYINREMDCHILTIEDPIEYYHEHHKGVVTQRELGVDVPSFSEAIIRGLRQDPDVILVGEMRELATMEAAITAAETGHLVLATLHTTGAATTVDRIIDAFPTEQQDQVRAQLSVSVIAVISQILLPRVDGNGRIAIFEIMIATPAIRSLIRERKTPAIVSAIQTGMKYGMRTMDESLFQFYQRQFISYEDVMSKCFQPEEMQNRLGSLQR